MSIIVQKFGGTSLADADKILSAARKAIAAQQAGHQVVMVVSAMGKNTDTLVELANQIHPRPPAREMDALLSTGEQVSASLMAMAINSLGHQAVSLSGAQIGIRTDSTHTKARIISISTSRIEQLLWRQRYHRRGPGRRARCRTLPNLHRRGWRLHDRSATGGKCPTIEPAEL